MAPGSIDAPPGYRRRIVIEPVAGRVTAALEDDYHRMAVAVMHDCGIATGVTAITERVPWTTCPGAELQLTRTFTGRPLARFGTVGERERNCTHLHDLALLAAAHANDPAATTIDILVSDPIDGSRTAEIQRDGAVAMRWRLDGGSIVSPEAIAGRTLHELGEWIAGLGAADKEAARLLRWGAMLANGRHIVVEKDTKQLPQGRCFTFQPDQFALAERRDPFLDFSVSGRRLLADLSTR